MKYSNAPEVTLLGRVGAHTRVKLRVGEIGICLSVFVYGIIVQLGTAAQARRPASAGIYSSEQASQGEAVYKKECAPCHGENLEGAAFATALKGDIFESRWRDGVVADLFTIIKVTMPQDRPSALSDTAYADVVAFLLKMNKYPPGEQPLPSDVTALKEMTFQQ